MQSEYRPVEWRNVSYTDRKLDNHTAPDQFFSDSNASQSQDYNRDIDLSCYDYIDDYQVVVAIKVELFISILLVVAGIVGNFISMIVMS